MRPRADLLTAIEQTAAETELLGATVLVAVSGGPDSLALLHALSALKERIGVGTLAVAHFDHGFRGEQSVAEADFVAIYCRGLGIPCQIGTAQPGSIVAGSRGSLQDAARAARYAFLESVADDIDAKFIMTAHNQGDQIETVLINILRGTGVDGLRGIPRLSGRYLRPLLDIDRATIEAYCTENGLTPRRDPSNDDPSHYLRNRIRLELLPMLERDYHAGASQAILRLSNAAAIDAAYLDDLAQAALEAVKTGETTLDAAALTALPHALRRRVARLAVLHVRGTRKGLTERQVEKALSLAAGEADATGFTISGPTCRVLRRGPLLVFEIPSATTAPAFSVSLPLPSSIILDSGWTIKVEGGTGELDSVGHSEIGGAYTATMDADRVDLLTLVVRSRVAGDRIDPLGMGGESKKLQDVFVDAKIDKTQRDGWPILADLNGPLWAPGLTQAERAKVTGSTTQQLILTAIRPLLAAP